MWMFAFDCRWRARCLKVSSRNGLNIWRIVTKASAHCPRLVSLLSPVQISTILIIFFFFSLLTHFQITGIYCKGTFDMFLCWPHSSPGNVSVPCPSYLPWISEGDNFIELLPFYTTTENMQPDGCAGRRKHACQCLAQSADDSRRGHRECLATGKWQERPNSSEPWRDDSECREDHYFKDKVMHHYWQNKVRGGVTTTFWLLSPKLDQEGLVFQRPSL